MEYALKDPMKELITGQIDKNPTILRLIEAAEEESRRSISYGSSSGSDSDNMSEKDDENFDSD